MKYISQIYRSVIPESLRWKVINYRKKHSENNVKRLILDYYKKHPTSDAEIKEALDYLSDNELSVFPYVFFNKYKHKLVDVFINPENDLPYVLHNNKKLYFKKSWTKEHIVSAYRFLLAEQDKKSSHCYLTENYFISEDSIVVDVGAAEGIFAINDIEKISHLYLIETDNEWIEALNETYKPWKHKITIVNKFVSDVDDENNLKLDSYFKNVKIDFLKIDVDGAEQKLINGAEYVIENNVKKISICTYHKDNDNDEFAKYLKAKAFSCENSSGYMLFYFDENFSPPYFRRGLIRATKI